MKPPHATFRSPDLRYLVSMLPVLAALATIIVLVQLGTAGAGPTDGPTPGIAIKRWGDSYPTGSGYDRYAYVNVGPADAGVAGALPTTSLVYTSGTSIYPAWSAGMTYQEALANNWLLKDSSGAYLMNVDYGAYVGDIGNPAYQQRFVDNVSALLARNGNEGAFIDDVLATSAGMSYGKFPAKYPTQQAWENAMVSFIAYVGQTLRARGYYVAVQAIAWIGGNPGSDDGSLNAAFWSRLAPYVSGIQSEYWLQDPNDVSRLRASGPQWYQHWDGWMELMNTAQSRGADFFGMMYGSSSSVESMRFGKASFLLGWDGSGGAFIFDLPMGDPWNQEWTMDIGQPAGVRYQVGLGWRREYTGGTALVNPSPSSSQTFGLGGTYTKADGTAVTSVTLAPTTGLVLKKQATSPPPPPANTALPVVSGTAEVGVNLSSSTGAWSNSPTGYAYQWKRCDTAGANCVSVAGVTAAQYALGAADLDKTMRVTVTATNAGGSASATSNATQVVVTPPPTSPPANTGLPAISGKTLEGSALSSSTGTWSNSPTGYSYHWKRCDSSGANCATITGATGTQYQLTAADVDKTMRVTVTASNDVGPTSATSNASAAVAPTPAPLPPAPTPQPPVNTALPVVSGQLNQGSALTSSTGAWTDSPTGYAYQWKRCDSAGANCASVGSNAAQYTLGSADVGKTMRVTVTASNAAGSSAATSNASAAVAPTPAPLPPAPTPQPPVNVVAPSVQGPAMVGKEQRASVGTWTNDPGRYTYQWRRCQEYSGPCEPIANATDTTYVPTPSDADLYVVVVVTAWNDGGSTSAVSTPRPNDKRMRP
jgi:hypothetical protein